MIDPCEHGVGILEYCRVCDENDECQPLPSLGYVERTEGDEMLPLTGQATEPAPWRLLIGLAVGVVGLIWWGCR